MLETKLVLGLAKIRLYRLVITKVMIVQLRLFFEMVTQNKDYNRHELAIRTFDFICYI